MWGRKDEAAPPPNTDAPATGRPAATPETGRSQASNATPRVSAGSGRSQAQIGKALKLKGEITGSEDVYVDGEVEGTIELRENTLTVGPNGNVKANVKARSITVLGRLEGNVTAGERIEIRKTGSLEGDLVTPRVVIEDGAVFRGSIYILRPSAEKSDPRADRQSNRPPVRQKAPSAVAAAVGATPTTVPSVGSAAGSKS